MVDQETRSALIDIVHHEHAHLKRLFGDIASTFQKIVTGESDVEAEADILRSAADDLDVALDEMLHHFNQEEEVFFVDLEERFPELGEDIAGLVESHETMCDKTRWLRSQIGAESEAIAENAEAILEVLESMSDLLVEHTEEENRIFEAALEQMPEQEQQELLAEMRKI
jgi:hemerythrin-like domain-containing protein